MPDPTAPPLSAHDQAMVSKVDQAHAATVAAAAPTPIGQVPPQEPPKPAEAPPAAPPAEPPKPPEEPPKPGEEPPKQEPPKEPEEPPKGPPSVQKFYDEFAQTGALSPESFTALESMGLPKNLVDTYIAGQVALAQARDNEGYELAGGKEQFTRMAAWAGQALSAEDQATFNTAVNGTPAQMKQAILALKAQYEASNGREPQLIQGERAAPSSEQAFASRAEVTAAMRDPRYRADPAYRAMVEHRIGLMQTF